MMTSVGLSAPETAASVRGGTMRFTEIDWRDQRFEPFTVAQVPEEALPALTEPLAKEGGLSLREDRMLRLATMPLLECLRSIPPLPRSVGLILALPETETARPLDRAGFVKRLALQTDGAFDFQSSNSDPKGRAGGLLAIGQAGNKIREGQASFFLAGGIDTYRDLYVLGRLDMDRRVKSSVQLDGFIPGEGAGFVLLASAKAAAAAGLHPLGLVSSVSEGREEGHLYSEKPYRGDGLATALAGFLEGNGSHAPIREVYSSMNGENHWAKEWGVAYLRNHAAFSPSHRMHHPADCFGDTGAACGPLMVGLAAMGIKHGYHEGPSLVYCSSDRGQRAVVAFSSN